MQHWYLLYCKRSEQQRAKLNLERQGVHCYYPQVEVEKVRNGKRSTKVEPLFPNYIFVQFDIEQIHTTTVRSTRGIVDFVRSGAKPTIIASEVIAQIMRHDVEQDQVSKLIDMPQSGDKVLIKDGPFAGIEAIFQEADGDKRAFLLIEIINQKTSISLTHSEYKKI